MSRAVWALVRRDLTVVLRSRPLTIPLIVVPVILTVLIPLALTLVARAASGTPEGAAKAAQLLASLPPLLRERLAGLGLDQVPVVALTVYVLAPLFLILPMMVASVLAADSFAGERERKTLESLLYTPLTDGELLLAKTAVSFVPAVAVTFASFLVYALVVNVAAWPLMGRIFFPPPMWLVLIGWVAPGPGIGSRARADLTTQLGDAQKQFSAGNAGADQAFFAAAFGAGPTRSSRRARV